MDKDFINQIRCGDCLEVMRSMPDGSVDLVITSPPYNIRNSTGNGFTQGSTSKTWANPAMANGYKNHDDAMPYDKYVEWQRECLTEMMRLIKDDGAIFYNHKRRVQNGLMQDRADIVEGFPVRQIIIWQRAGGLNFNAGYFVPTYELLYMIAKKDFRLVPKANRHGDVWKIRQEMNNPHPAPFPVALVNRILSSTKAEIILDPFMGSGTTAVAAHKLRRKYIGIEKSSEYVKMAKVRIQKAAKNNLSVFEVAQKNA